MSRAYRLSAATFGLLVSVPFAWIACGGGSKPPETPSDEKAAESAEAAGDAAPAASESAEPAAASASAPAPASTPSATAAASPPPAPPLGSTDCGRCIEKTCAKPSAACGKNADCQATLESIHECSSNKAPAACIDSAAPPTAAKPKKLATAYEGCAKKAIAKTCKAKCQ